MKNADKPIYPIYAKDNSLADEADENYLFKNKSLIGITKREYFAGLAMQGLIAGRKDELYKIDSITIKMYIKISVELTDELLKQLENQ